MTETTATGDEERILVRLADGGNRRVLEQWLQSQDQYRLVNESKDVATASFDCCILDRELLLEEREALLARKDDQQVVLPYLLVVPSDRHTVIREHLQQEHPALWEAIDGLIDMPISEGRLAEQLETFIRLRNQSISAHTQREQLQQIRDQHTGHGVIITDKEGVIEYVNEAFERQSGYTAAEARGRTPAILKSGEQDEEFYEDLWGTILSGDIWEGTVVNEHKNGKHYVVNQTIAPLENHDGEVAQFVAINHEITELKEMEGRLRNQRGQLAVLNRVLRHDIRNDMEIILTWAELLGEEVPDTSRDHLERILRAGRHVVELTTVARDLSELIHEGESRELDDISLKRVLEGELEKRRETHDDAEITLVEPPSEQTHVLANELLASVFRNLINNAVLHNDSAAPEVRISVEEDDDVVQVRVADNGPGVPEDMKERLFAEGEKGLESGGTGIGLFLVQNLVESYGGDIWVEDRSGTDTDDTTGAVFVVELQAVTQESTNEPWG